MAFITLLIFLLISVFPPRLITLQVQKPDLSFVTLLTASHIVHGKE